MKTWKILKGSTTLKELINLKYVRRKEDRDRTVVRFSTINTRKIEEEQSNQGTDKVVEGIQKKDHYHLLKYPLFRTTIFFAFKLQVFSNRLPLVCLSFYVM